MSPSHRAHEDDSRNQGDLTTAESHSMMVVPKQNFDYSLSETKNYHENLVKSSEGEPASDAPQKWWSPWPLCIYSVILKGTLTK